jgi:uncharacterized protein with GYD domain
MRFYFLGTYSEIGLKGMMNSSFSARKTAIQSMLRNIDGSLLHMSYLQGEYDVIAHIDLDCYETASGLKSVMTLSGGWDKLLILPEMNIDKALASGAKLGSYTLPGTE